MHSQTNLSQNRESLTFDSQNYQNQQLFSELENIFEKNKKWMEEQKSRERNIKSLADHYKE